MACQKVNKLNSHIIQGLLRRCLFKSVFPSSSLCTTPVTSQKYDFVMPERIPRSPTDILKALDSTVSRDKSGPHYRYHDDPYLTPVSNKDKRIYSLSRESGRKAAHWIKESNPDLFRYSFEEPQIKDFYPEVQFTEESSVTEHTLQELIHSARVKDAATVYRLCQSKGIEVSAAVEQSLLELLCFFNEDDPPSDMWLEEQTFIKIIRPGKNTTNTWKIGSLSDELFQKLDGSPAAYNAIIRGLAKYNHVDDAWDHYRSALQGGVPLSAATYNAMLLTVTLRNLNYEQCWDLLRGILESMAAKGVQPDLQTLNNSLQVLDMNSGFRKARNYSLQLVKEFSLQGIKPSLASYYFLLNLHCRDRDARNNLLFSILDELDKEEGDLEPRDPRDAFFFMQAMHVCQKNLKSLDAAHRVNRILETGNNELFLPFNIMETVYYRNFLQLALDSLSLPEFMELYDQLVPHVYSIEKDLVDTILTSIGVQGSFHYLPTIWTDLNAVNLHKNDQIVSSLLTTMCYYRPESDFSQPKSAEEQKTGSSADASSKALSIAEATAASATEVISLPEQFRSIIEHIVMQIKELAEDKREMKGHIQWTSIMVGQMLQILSVVGDAEIGGRLLQAVHIKPDMIVGEITSADLQLLLHLAIREDNPDVAMTTAVVCQEHNPADAKEFAEKIIQMPSLTAIHRAKLAIAFGVTVSQEQDEKKCNKSTEETSRS